MKKHRNSAKIVMYKLSFQEFYNMAEHNSPIFLISQRLCYCILKGFRRLSYLCSKCFFNCVGWPVCHLSLWDGWGSLSVICPSPPGMEGDSGMLDLYFFALSGRGMSGGERGQGQKDRFTISPDLTLDSLYFYPTQNCTVE